MFRAVRHLLQAEITGMRHDAGIEMGQQSGPQRIGTSRMHKVVGEMRPGIDFNEQLTERLSGNQCLINQSLRSLYKQSKKPLIQ